MADTTYRTQFFFEGVQAARSYSSSMVGWVETWYFTSSRAIDEAIMDQAIDQYILKRRAFMPSLYRIVWVRMSDVANPRSTKTKAVFAGAGLYSGPPTNLPEMVTLPDGSTRPVQPQGGPTVNPNVASAQVTCAVLVDFMRRGREAGAPPELPPEPSHHRRFLIRGLPADIMNGNVISTFSQSFSRLTAFLDYLGIHESAVPPAAGAVASPFKLRFLHPTSLRTYPITNLVVHPDNHRRVDLTATNLPATAKGDRVQIAGVKEMDRVNRFWTVVTNGALGGPTLLGTAKRDINGGPGVSGYARINKYDYGPADQYLIIGLRTKSTGRPFRLTRGRRRVL